jgi:hypothetical protein
MDHNPDDEGPAQYASPPCFLHELQPGYKAGHVDPVAWADVARWRKAERARLIEARLAIPAEIRAEMAAKPWGWTPRSAMSPERPSVSIGRFAASPI